MSSGFVTVAPTSRGTRTSRRRRNKDKTAKSSAPSTTIASPTEPAPPSQPVSKTQPSTQQASSNKIPVSETPARPTVNKNGIKSSPSATVAATATTTTTTTTTTTSTTANSTATTNTPSNEPIQSQTKTSSVWDRRKQARAQSKPKNAPNPTKPTKPIQPSRPISRPSVPKPQLGGTGLSGKSRGFGSRRRIAHSYDANSVDMTRRLPQRQIQSEQESFPSLQQANAKKPKPTQTASKPAPSASSSSTSTASKLRTSGGYRPSKRTAVQYDPNSVDMTRKPPPTREIRANPRTPTDVGVAPNKPSAGGLPSRPAAGARPSGAGLSSRSSGGGLSSRSRGYRAQRTASEQVRPTSNVPNSSVSVSSVTFGRGARRYVPPQIRTLSDNDRTKIVGTKGKTAPIGMDNKATEKKGGNASARPNTQIALNTSPKRIQSKPKPQPKPKQQPKPAQPQKKIQTKPTVIVTPKRNQDASVKRDNISPAKSTQSNSSRSSASSASSSSSSKKKAAAALQLSAHTKKYLAMRTKKSIKDVFLIKRETKNLHDVASIKTQLTKKIAETDDSASNEYYYNKNDMLDFVENADFNALNDTSVEVTHEKDERLKSTVEAYNPFFQTTITTPTTNQTPTTAQTPTGNLFGAVASDVYAQDGLPATNAVAYGFNDTSNEIMMTEENKNIMIPTHAPGQYGQDINNIAEPFPGMLANVPIITDQNEIAANAEIANRSKLRPMVQEFVPGAIPGAMQPAQIQPFTSNQSPLMNQFGATQFVAAPTAAASTNPLTQFQANTILQFNRNAAVSNQQWVNNEQSQSHPPQPPPQQAPQPPQTQAPQSQHQGSVGFKPHQNRYGRDNRNPRRQYNSNRNNNHPRRYNAQRYNNNNGNNPRYPRDNRNNARYPRDPRDPRDNRNKYGQFQRRDRMKQQEMAEHEKKAFKQSMLEPESVVQRTLDANILPRWPFGEGNEEMERRQITDVYDANGKLLVRDIYLNFLCSPVSDGVFECLSFREIISLMVPILNKRLYRRLHDTAPVFHTLCISDWNVELKSGTAPISGNARADNYANEGKFVKYIGNGDVLCRKGLLAYANRNGLRTFHISYSKSLSDWLCCVCWNDLKEYLESAKNLETVIIRGCGTQDVFDVSKYAADKMEELIALFSCLVATKTFIVESAPFHINSGFITNLSAIISDLRLFDSKIQWNMDFLNSIKNHFCHLDRLGIPANCISQSTLSMPTLIDCIEGSVHELIIKNTVKHKSRKRLQRQDLAMLFERFDVIEIDSSLIDDYPSIKNQTRIKTISIESDTHNFFIPLLRNMPCSVTHLIIKNSNYSTNNLIIDVSQKSKWNTNNIRTLTLYGFENNVKQIQNLLNHNLFPNLTTLNIETKKNKNNLKISNTNAKINIKHKPLKY